MTSPGDQPTVNVKELLGKSVVDAEAQDFGKVEDVVLDLEQGRVTALIVRTGLPLMPGARHEVLPTEVGKVGDRVLLKVKKEAVLQRVRQ